MYMLKGSRFNISLAVAVTLRWQWIPGQTRLPEDQML